MYKNGNRGHVYNVGNIVKLHTWVENSKKKKIAGRNTRKKKWMSAIGVL